MTADTAAARFLGGPKLLGQGLVLCLRNPRLLLLGIAPALVTGVLLGAALIALLLFTGDLAALITPFADGWDPLARTAIRVLAGAAVAGLAIVLAILMFTALTLAIGAPFYEHISGRVEEQVGGVPPASEQPLLRSVLRGLADALRMVGLSLLFGIPVFALGFVPVIGQVAALVLGAFVAGWFLALELAAVPFERRGLRLADRRAALGQDRARALGFGVTVFLCFLIPFGAILLMPAAVAGGTLLARRHLG